MGDRLKLWYYTELKKLYQLNWKEKIEYSWSYYKLWIIGIASFLFLTVFLVVRISTNVEEHWLYGIFTNTMADAGTGSALWEDFTDYAQLDLTEKKVEFNAEVYFDYLKNQAKGNDYYNAFVALSDSGILDFITMEPASLEAAFVRLRISTAFYTFNSFMAVISGIIRGHGHSTAPALITFLGCCVLRIVWVYTFFAAAPSLTRLFTVYPVSWITTTAALGVCCAVIRRRQRKLS